MLIKSIEEEERSELSRLLRSFLLLECDEIEVTPDELLPPPVAPAEAEEVLTLALVVVVDTEIWLLD